MRWHRSLLCLIGMLLTGCRSPYMGRAPLLRDRQYAEVGKLATADLALLGNLDVRGVIGKQVRTTQGVLDASFFHHGEVAWGTVPIAYFDLACVALAEHRYLETIRLANETIRQTSAYLAKDEWFVLRVEQLEACHRLLYQAQLGVGNVHAAAVHYRHYLLLHQATQARSYKHLLQQMNCVRMTSMRRESEYRTQYHWSRVSQIWMTVFAAASMSASQDASQRGDHAAAARLQLQAQASMVAVTSIEVALAQLKVELDVDMRGLIDRVANMAREQDEPRPDDVARVKRASDLYRLVMARDATSPGDAASLAQLDEMIRGCMAGLTVRVQANGQIAVSGPLATLLDLQARLERVPLQLPTNGLDIDDERLNRLLTPEMYRLAGLHVSAGELALLRSLVVDDQATFDLNTEEGRKAYAALRRIERKAREYQAWRSTSS